MSVDEEALKAEYLPALEKFWKVVWIEEKPLKKEQVTDDDVFHYLDFGEHFPAVQLFCGPVQDKLYIQQEYVDAFEMFEGNSNIYRKGARVLGQSGIGKTCFIAYAVFERLRKKEPVAVEVTHWDDTRRYLLFTVEGVSIHRGWARTPLQRHPGIWAFSDSNAHVPIPTTAFTDTPGVRTFQVTSPKGVRYKEWTMQSRVSPYIMNIPSGKEIQRLSLVLGNNIATMQSLADQWGNVPHTLLDLYDKPASRRPRENLVRRLMDQSTGDISRILGALDALDTGSDGPSPIFFIQPLRREGGILDRMDHDIFIPTPWLQDEVVNGIARHKLEGGERMELLDLMTSSTKGRSTRGNIIESIVRRHLSGDKPIPVR